jgi:hypothetical protein
MDDLRVDQLEEQLKHARQVAEEAEIKYDEVSRIVPNPYEKHFFQKIRKKISIKGDAGLLWCTSM